MKISFSVKGNNFYTYLCDTDDIMVDEEHSIIYVNLESEDYDFAKSNFYEIDKVSEIEKRYKSLKNYFGYCSIISNKFTLKAKNKDIKFSLGE